MKRYSVLLFCTIVIVGCCNKTLSRSEIVANYYHALNVSDFTQLKPLLADTLTIAEGDYILSYPCEDFNEYFKWDSIFQPSYKIIELTEHGNEIIATLSLSSRRFEFLKNNPFTCRFRISFNEERITKLETIEYLDADWDTWNKQRDSLVNWININYPELDGFINDLTMKGAINYVRAISLYTNRKNIQ